MKDRKALKNRELLYSAYTGGASLSNVEAKFSENGLVRDTIAVLARVQLFFPKREPNFPTKNTLMLS